MFRFFGAFLNLFWHFGGFEMSGISPIGSLSGISPIGSLSGISPIG
jgi:hypothetical protein